MANVGIEKIRNVILLAHSKAGKTSLTESILFNTGAISRIGTVEAGNTTTDFEQEEIDRNMTISSSLVRCDWNNYKINLIDTPGFNNFIEDAKGCLKAVDGAVIIVSAISGVKGETEKLWRYACEAKVPGIIFINKMDKENANFSSAVSEIKDSFDKDPLLLNMPIGQGESFSGIVDIVNLKAYEFNGNKVKEIDIPEDLKAEVDKHRNNLIEAAAEADDALLEKYLEGVELTQKEILAGIKKTALTGSFIPVVCGSAVKNIAIAKLIDTITMCLPSPLEIAEIRPIIAGNAKDDSVVERKPSDKDPLSAFVFKTIADPYSGQLSLFRIFSGEIKSADTVYNINKRSKERIGHVFYMLGKEHNEVESFGAGDIGVVAKLKDTKTGDTLCDHSSPIIFDQVSIAEPIISYAIKPKSKGDEDKVSIGLHKILEEDVALKFHREDETNEMIISGMGQLHVEVALQKLKRKFGVDVEMQSPKVPYRETILGGARAQGKYKKQSGGKGQYGDCWIDIKPRQHGEGFLFVNNVVGGSIPKQYIPAVEKGIIERMKKGILAGYPLIDVEVSLFDGSFHAVDSSEMAFKIAGSFAVKKAVMAANPILLEPIMNVEIYTDENGLSNVMGDLNSKRGRIQGVEPLKKGNQKVLASVPMAEMLTYANQLHSITSGKGTYTMEFSNYEQVPAHIAQKIVDEKVNEEEMAGAK
jgi:elongation factor G